VDTDVTTALIDWPDFASTFDIGRSPYEGGTYKYLNGHIDEFRVTKGKARWTANFTVPNIPYSTVAQYALVGFYRPIDGLKFYIGNANPESSTMTVKEWQGHSWETLAVTDNTDTGATLAVTGTVTWTLTNKAQVRYIQGLSLYWYQISIDAGEATIYKVTVDAPFGDVRNIWDGGTIPVASCRLYEDSTYKNYTDEVNDDTTTYVMTMDALVAGTEYLLLGFTEPVQGFNISFVAGRENTDATVLTVYFWNGTAWSQVIGKIDGTDEPAGDSFGKSGTISFQPNAAGQEFTRSIAGETPLYYYKLVWSAALDAEVEVYHITGIPAPEAIGGYKFPGMFQNRAWLFSETYGDKNKAIYSVFDAPDIWNGADSGYITFGDDTELVAACTIYNVFQTTGYEQLIVCKEHETYRLVGDNPTNWVKTTMSTNIGCVAPLSMAVCDVAATAEGIRRQVAVWQTDTGVVMCDGATIVNISHDVKCYWDENDSRCIPTARLDDSVGSYNPVTQSYTLLISSGSAATAAHNVELEYSIPNQEWTKIYRENASGANPLQIIFPVYDTGGKFYPYGATNEGYMYRLEYGNSWDGTLIAQYVKTKNLFLDDQTPLMHRSIIEYIRLLFEDKNGGGNIAVAHYGDDVLTVDGTNDQKTPAVISMSDGPYETRDVYLGPALMHSFLISASPTTVYDGLELTGLGIWYSKEGTIYNPE